MQCPSCHFENMPGSKNCARCRAFLTIVDIDVNPPRATIRQRAIPNFLPRSLKRIRYRILDSIQAAFHTRLTGVQFDGTLVDWLSLLVGGLNQWRRGEPRGWLWFYSWLLLLFLSLLWAGTTIGSFMLGLLFGLHVASIIGLFFRQFEEFSVRIRATVVVLFFTGLLYYSLLSLIVSFVVPIRFGMNTDELRAGDVIWYRPGLQTRPGDVVVYDLPAVQIAGRRGNIAIQVALRGMRVNRLVATSGQRVQWKQKQLFVDGRVCVWQPGSTMNLFESFDFLVPANSVFILPEDLVEDADLQNLSKLGPTTGTVPTTTVRGPVWLRSYPLFRMKLYSNRTVSLRWITGQPNC